MYSYCMLPNIAKQSLLNNWSLDLQSFEIHIGGDHGQGAFQAPVKINFYYENEYSSYETWFFQVDCDKESYELLEKTFATPLSTGIKMMIEKEVVGGESPDGHAFFSVNPDGLVDCCFARSGEEKEGQQEVPFKVYISGDLAFYSTILGKDGCLGQHCYLCDMPRLDW